MQIKISNLSKTYSNGVKALSDINLTISQGMFGLLGPNGAGKSTLMRTIAALQEPDSGSIFLDDINILHDKMAVRRVLGYLPQEFDVYPRVKTERNRQQRRAPGHYQCLTSENQSMGVPQTLCQYVFRWHETAIRNCPGSIGRTAVNNC